MYAVDLDLKNSREFLNIYIHHMGVELRGFRILVPKKLIWKS
ncbi:hypothetical protein ABOONEI_2768 [Aciduliprofundum boonei T469]|nr:hypothetical protein ABOONEI_2768 [Aciduliprofundum boonei T469]